MTDDTIPPTDSQVLSDHIKPVSIIDEMKSAYLDYAMSVIVSRALPDARDGLKPVHRRILFSMHENGYDWNKAYRKSARVVGDVIGKYHPHGDSAVYDALVRMAQDFSMGLVLIDGQGNFGSVDGDPPAAMRYTEVRLQKPAHSLLSDLDKDTVDFKENYDNSEQEPVVMPAKFPNLLVNGSGGIAVGMATNIPPFNMGEVINASLALLDNPDLDDEDMLSLIPAPDFPTGGLILGQAGTRGMHKEGRGSVIVRGRVEVELTAQERERIIVRELPYQVNKATLIEKIAENVREKRLEGISDIRDESDRDGMRVVIEIKRDSTAQVVLNNLYKQTQLQSSFPGNLVALDRGKPQTMTIRQLLDAFLDFRVEVVVRRTKFLLAKARDRAHLLIGLALAVSNIDEVIRIIRGAKDPNAAREELLAKTWDVADVADLLRLVDDHRNHVQDGKIKLSDEQVRAILELRLQRLTQMGREEIDGEMAILAEKISDYLDILTKRERIIDIIRQELIEVRDEFAVPRRSEIVEFDGDLEDEDLIQREDMVVTISHGGYVKRVPLDTYRAQRRGGKGRSGMSTKEEDFVSHILVVNTHTNLLFFTSEGMVYKQKVWRLPLGSPQNRGKALINYLPLSENERITSILPMPDDDTDLDTIDLMFSTQRGTVRRNKIADFTNVHRGGKIAMKLDEGDHIVGVLTCLESDDIVLTTSHGQAIRFSVNDVRVFKGRGSIGVRGIALAKGDEVISMTVINGMGSINSEERSAYLKRANLARRTADDVIENVSEEQSAQEISLSDEQYAEMGALEQFLLTVSENGFAKRTSTYEYRRTGRGGKGITAMVVNERNGGLIASFPVEEDDQIMLVTNGGQLIRTPIKDIRIAGRVTQGVTVFNTAKDEKVVSVQAVRETNTEDDDSEGGDVSVSSEQD